MPSIDMPLDELVEYAPARTEPDDFDEFWAGTLAQAREHDLAPEFVTVDSGLSALSVADVSFSGYGGERIKAWLATPTGAEGPLPCVVEFPGYGGGRGLPHDVLLYAAAGYAHLFVDIRGQGSNWRPGHTPDRSVDVNPHFTGFMTRGILDPATYYYRRVFTDGVRAVEAARAHPLVDPGRVAVAGGSQGGAITLAMSGLVPDLAAVLPDVPFLCHFRRAVATASEGPFREIEGYLKVHRDHVDRVFTTLSYFDGVNFAARANAPSLFGVGLLDTVCPPSTVFAAHHHYAGPKQIEVYHFNDHEGGQTFHVGASLRFLSSIMGRA